MEVYQGSWMGYSSLSSAGFALNPEWKEDNLSDLRSHGALDSPLQTGWASDPTDNRSTIYEADKEWDTQFSLSVYLNSGLMSKEYSTSLIMISIFQNNGINTWPSCWEKTKDQALTVTSIRSLETGLCRDTKEARQGAGAMNQTQAII